MKNTSLLILEFLNIFRLEVSNPGNILKIFQRLSGYRYDFFFSGSFESPDHQLHFDFCFTKSDVLKLNRGYATANFGKSNAAQKNLK